MALVNSKIEVQNIPDYALEKDYNYWLVRYVESQLWFYGAYNNEQDANTALSNIDNGLLISNPII